MKFNVRVRIIDPHHRAKHEDQVYEADSGLDAMLKAQADEKNTSRGLVQCNGCDPLPLEDGEFVAPQPDPVDEAPKPKNKGGRPKKAKPDDAASAPVE